MPERTRSRSPLRVPRGRPITLGGYVHEPAVVAAVAPAPAPQLAAPAAAAAPLFAASAQLSTGTCEPPGTGAFGAALGGRADGAFAAVPFWMRRAPTPILPTSPAHALRSAAQALHLLHKHCISAAQGKYYAAQGMYYEIGRAHV